MNYTSLLRRKRGRIMNDEITTITEKQIDDNSAEIREKSQRHKAEQLRKKQRAAAEDLLLDQIDFPETNIESLQRQAAKKLKEAQNGAALALQEAQAEAAQILKRNQKRAAKKLLEKNQTIKCLIGGYSVENEDKD